MRSIHGFQIGLLRLLGVSENRVYYRILISEFYLHISWQEKWNEFHFP